MVKVLQFDSQFIQEHMEELIHLEDYVPEISFIVYDKQNERDDFLKSKNLLKTMCEMDQLLDEKCKHSKNPIRARDSIIIEWLELYPEFEGIIAEESLEKYQQLKNNNEFIKFLDLLYKIQLPSERIMKNNRDSIDGMSIKDDSRIQLPNFDMMNNVYENYGASLLADYLAYLV